jgi:hypothetical protein
VLSIGNFGKGNRLSANLTLGKHQNPCLITLFIKNLTSEVFCTYLGSTIVLPHLKYLIKKSKSVHNIKSRIKTSSLIGLFAKVKIRIFSLCKWFKNSQ